MSNWELGKAEPRLADLLRLADFYGVTVDWLLRGGKAPGAGRNGLDAHGVLDLFTPTEFGHAPDFFLSTPFRFTHVDLLYGEPVDAIMVVPQWSDTVRKVRWPSWVYPGDLLLLRTILADTQGIFFRQPKRPGAVCLLARHREPSGPSYNFYRLDGKIQSKWEDDKNGLLYYEAPVADTDQSREILRVDPWKDQVLYEVLFIVRQVSIAMTSVQAGPSVLPEPTVESLAAVEGVGPEGVSVLRAALQAEQGLRREEYGIPAGWAHPLEEPTSPSSPTAALVDTITEASAASLALLEGGTSSARLAKMLRLFARYLGRSDTFADRAGKDDAPRDLATQTEAARLVGVSRQAVNLAVKTGRLPTYRRGNDELVSLREARMLVGGQPVAGRGPTRPEAASGSVEADAFAPGGPAQGAMSESEERQSTGTAMSATQPVGSGDAVAEERGTGGTANPDMVAETAGAAAGPADGTEEEAARRSAPTTHQGAPVPDEEASAEPTLPSDAAVEPAPPADATEEMEAPAAEQSEAPSEEAAISEAPAAGATEEPAPTADAAETLPTAAPRVRAAEIAAVPREYLWWVDADLPREVYLRNIENPPPDQPPPLDYARYCEVEENFSAAYGPQFEEYPERIKQSEFAARVKGVWEEYQKNPDWRSHAWKESLRRHGPLAPPLYPDDEDEWGNPLDP